MVEWYVGCIRDARSYIMNGIAKSIFWRKEFKMKNEKFLSRIGAAAVSAVVLASTVSSTAAIAAGKTEETKAAPISEVVNDSGLDYDYARALQYSIYFYDANMCGTEVEEHNRLSWRGNCHTYDAKVPLQPMDSKNVGTNLSAAQISKLKDVLDPDGDGYVDVAGGFHDAGDHVEFGMPENYAAATLGWGYYEFRDAYVKTGQDDHIEEIVRCFNDYLMKCTFRDKNGEVVAHCYQVGDGDIDHAIWEAPEVDSMARPAFFLTADKPQTDYVVSAAASLAINYLNFKDTDPDYAEKSLDYAIALWDFANSHELEVSDNGDGPKQYYKSNKWEDDYCWAASWLYECTGDSTYMEMAAPYYDYYAPSGWCYCWNDVWSGAGLRWAVINETHPELDLINVIRKAQGKNQYVFDNIWEEVEKCMPTWQALETPGGYAFLQIWGSARYNTAMQLIALLIDKYHNGGKPGANSEWAQKQMHYIMGDNPMNRCYIVGYNDSSVKYPHHRAASGLLEAEDPREHRHILWGALAGGPDDADSHTDVTSDWVGNEVTIDYNAAFVGACAGLYEYFGTADMAPTPNFPPEDEKRGGDDANGGSSSSGYWVEACGIDDINADGAGVTKVSFKVCSGATKPSTKVKVRYFFNIKEISGGIDAVNTAKELYDQSSAEVEDADGIMSGPFKYEKLADTYYVDVDWDGYAIANSGKKYQFILGLYYGDKWDPSNDWSYNGLKIYDKDDAFFGNGNEEENPNICVYDDGVLVGGTEPDGTVPDTAKKEEQKTTTATSDVKETTTTSKKNDSGSASNSEFVYGDLNGDGVADLTDLTKMSIYLMNHNIPESLKKAADVDGSGEFDIADLPHFKQYISKDSSVKVLGPR